MSSEQVATDVVARAPDAAPAPEPKPGRGLSSRWLLLIAAVIVLDVVAFIVFPQIPKDGTPGELRVPGLLHREHPRVPGAAHRHRLRPGRRVRPPTDLVTFHPSISNTILTMWIVMAVVLIGAILMVRGSKLIPGRGQNIFETVYEFLERLRARARRRRRPRRTSRSSSARSC